MRWDREIRVGGGCHCSKPPWIPGRCGSAVILIISPGQGRQRNSSLKIRLSLINKGKATLLFLERFFSCYPVQPHRSFAQETYMAWAGGLYCFLGPLI